MLTDEHEHAMKVWREACGEYEGASSPLLHTSSRDMVIAGDQAATAVIAREFEALEAEKVRLREALEEIMGLPGEINPSNYDHDDVCELNRQFCYGYAIARAALGASHDA